jgi:molybdopterin synthase catalytic subunit
MTQKIKNIFTNGPISPDFIATCIQKHQSQDSIGAHSLFLGQVRSDILQGKKVVAIDYSSYEEMALEKMTRLREYIFEKYDLTCLHVHHSKGLVKTGEICLFVMTSSIHRKAAIDACGEIIEKIKLELPIWGKEIFEDNTHHWKVNILA